MAEPTRLAKLPGYDTAPDVYETPELTDDTTTTAQTNETASETGESEGDDGDDSEPQEDGPFGAISRRRLFPERARSRFQAVGSRVDAKGLDLSDRVDGRRKGLRVKRRVYGVEEDESLEARIARLRREVEECRALSQNEPAKDSDKEATAEQNEGLDTLSKALAELEGGERRPRRATQTRPQSAQNQESLRDEQEITDEQTLGKVAAFDTRLTALEKALGLSSLDLGPDGSFTSPLLPSLNLLDQQMSALMTSTSIAQLDAASSRIKKLSQEAEQLAQSTRPESNGHDSEAEDESSVPASISTEDAEKLRALYNLLPTVQSLAPTVPALLERLRSLTVLHTGAASAADELDKLEKRQANIDADIKTWTEGLEKVEAVIREASEANGRNGKVVQGWVKDLEGRIAALR